MRGVAKMANVRNMLGTVVMDVILSFNLPLEINVANKQKMFKKAKCCQQLPAHPILGRPSPNNLAGESGNGIGDGVKIRRQKDIYLSPRSEAYTYTFALFQTHLLSHLVPAFHFLFS
jgi:hypothetical protein